MLRARSGIGRLALEVPEAHVTLVAVEGTADLTGFPRRPRIRVRFFDPAGGQPRPDEDPAELSARLLAEIRALVPPVAPYRKRCSEDAVSRRARAVALEGVPGAAEGRGAVAARFAGLACRRRRCRAGGRRR